MSQQEVWNKIAEKWAEYRNRTPNEVDEFLKDKKGKILDLGCGSGRNIIPNNNIKYYGVDFSEEMLKFAEINAKSNQINAIFFQTDIGKEKLPFKNDFFDAAVFISTLHCIPSAEDRENSIKELFRVMKKGSNAMISVWKKEAIIKKLEPKKTDGVEVNIKNLKETFVNWKKDGKNHQRYYYFYEKEELESLLKSVGFKILNLKTKEGKTLIGNHPRTNFLVYVQKK